MPWYPDKSIQNDAAYLAPQVNELTEQLAETSTKVIYFSSEYPIEPFANQILYRIL